MQKVFDAERVKESAKWAERQQAKAARKNKERNDSVGETPQNSPTAKERAENGNDATTGDDVTVMQDDCPLAEITQAPNEQSSAGVEEMEEDVLLDAPPPEVEDIINDADSFG